MSLDLNQFKEYIIIPALQVIELHSDAAVELVLGTCIQESHLQYLKQLGGGPAVGVIQMEPNTHEDIWDNYLAYQSELSGRVLSLAAPNGGVHPRSNELIGNLWYACAMCRVHYRRVSDPLPGQGEYEDQAAYWKEFYNTPMGSGTEEEYLENWDLYGGAKA